MTRRAALGAVAAGGAPLLQGRNEGGHRIATEASAMVRARLDSGEIAFITPDQLGAAKDRDSTAALEAAMRLSAQTGKPIELNGIVRVDGPVAVPGGFALRGNGTIDLSGGGSIAIGTGVTALPGLAADIPLFGTVLAFRAAHGLAAGDVVAVWHPADYSFAPFRRYYREGDMFRVAEIIDATHVRIFGTAQDPHPAGAVKMFRLNGQFLRIEGIAIAPPPTGVALFLDGLADVLLRGIRIGNGAGHTGIEVHRCYDVGISDAAITVLEGDAYPIILSNSQKVTVGMTRGLYSSRHCLALGGRDGEACVPTADVIVSGIIGANIATNGIGAADIHGNCKRIAYDNCVLSMANIAGRHVAFRNCRITGRPPGAKTSGCAIAGSEISGGTVTVENCHIVSTGDGITEACFLDLAVSRRTSDLHIVMRDNTFEHVGEAPSAGYLIKLFIGDDASASTKAIDMDISGLKYIGAGPPLAIVGLSGQADMSKAASIRLDGFSGAHATILACSRETNYDIAFSGLRDELTGLSRVGDVSATLSADRVSTAGPPSSRVNVWTAPLKADRTVSLDTTRARAGDSFRLVRAASSTGEYRLTIASRPPRALTAGQWCEVTFDGAAWVPVGAGPL